MFTQIHENQEWLTLLGGRLQSLLSEKRLINILIGIDIDITQIHKNQEWSTVLGGRLQSLLSDQWILFELIVI